MKVDKLSASCQLKGSREVTKRLWAAPGTPLQVDGALFHKRFRFSSLKNNNILQLPVLFLHSTRRICTLFKCTDMFRTIAVYPQGTSTSLTPLQSTEYYIYIRNPNNIHSPNLFKASQCETFVVIVMCA